VSGKIKRKLLVSSGRGNPAPSNGYTLYDDGQQVSCKINDPLIDKAVSVWKCVGWSGTGSVPSKGEGTDVTFPITEDSSITWEWTRTPNPGQIVTLVALIALFVFAFESYVHLRSVFLTAASVGAIGGLVHEIIQSGGKYVLPSTDQNQNFCLGGLVGIISGIVAGVVLFEGLSITTVSQQLIALAFTAGVALKGVADAPNPTKSTSTS